MAIEFKHGSQLYSCFLIHSPCEVENLVRPWVCKCTRVSAVDFQQAPLLFLQHLPAPGVGFIYPQWHNEEYFRGRIKVENLFQKLFVLFDLMEHRVADNSLSLEI